MIGATFLPCTTRVQLPIGTIRLEFTKILSGPKSVFIRPTVPLFNVTRTIFESRTAASLLPFFARTDASGDYTRRQRKRYDQNFHGIRFV